MRGRRTSWNERATFSQEMFPIVSYASSISTSSNEENNKKKEQQFPNLPIIMTRTRRETVFEQLRRRLRGRTNKWENIGGGNRVQAIRRLEPDRPSVQLDSVVPAADARDFWRLGRHLFHQ